MRSLNLKAGYICCRADFIRASSSHPPPIMLQFQSCLDKYRSQAETSAAHRQDVCQSFKIMTDWLATLANLYPDNKETLVEDQDIWMGRFGAALVSGNIRAQCSC